MRKRSNYKPKVIRAPGIRLAEKDAESLAFRTHVAALMLDTADGMNQFTEIVCKVSVAMAYSETIDRHARSILSTATKMLDEVIKTGTLTARQHDYLKRTAGFIDDWLQQGRVTYAALQYSKSLMAQDKREREAKQQEVCA